MGGLHVFRVVLMFADKHTKEYLFANGGKVGYINRI